MTRRSFIHAIGAAPLAATAGEPVFPTPAHQLVWRNWDLVPAARIADALSASTRTVATLAAAMDLGEQSLDARYWPRLRFKALQRNWDFVAFEQLETLVQMREPEIRQLLSQDAFYIGHLGPKPDCPAIRAASPVSDRVIPHFRRPRMAGTPEPRFRFIEDVARPIPQPAWVAAGKPDFAPRIAFPYFAQYGDVLGAEDFDSYYPGGLLANMARLGLSAIWLHAVLHELVPSRIFPEFGRESQVRLGRLNALIAEARKHGLGVYLYLNEPRAMPESFFARHPELKGAPGRPGDGLASMCTSTEPVRRYVAEATEALFRGAPDLTGVLLITASENPTNCYSLTREPACPRCRKRPGPEVIGEVVRLIEQGARAAQRDAHVVAWDWSWGIIEDDPQERIIAALPSTVTLMVDFERGTSIERAGVRTTVDEYSLSVRGPSPRAAAHIRQAGGRGMRVMAKVQVGNTWELSLLPNIPVPHLVARTFASMRAAGIGGAMESWTLGACPSLNWQVAQAFYAGSPGEDAAVERVARALYGKTAAPAVTAAWRTFAKTFAEYPFSNSLVYSSVVQCGPAHPLWFEPSSRKARILNSYDTLGWTSPYGPEKAAQMFAGMAAGWQQGLEQLRAALRNVPAARADLRIAEAVGLYFRSIANQVRFHALRDRGALDSARPLVEDDLKATERFLEICEEDSRVGFEASLQYFYLPLDIREKIAACRFALERRWK